MSFFFKFPTFVFASVFGGPLAGTSGRDIIFGSRSDDDIDAGAGNDLIFAGRGNDTITVGAGHDRAFGGAGDDLFIAGGGYNTYFGGRGQDAVSYAGALEDYDIDFGRNGRATITRSDTAPEGTGKDRLFKVETVTFGSGETIFLDGRNNAAIGRDDDVAFGEDGGTVLAADLLANDLEVDGDTLEVVSVDGTSASGATLTLANGEVTYDPGALFDSLKAGEVATDTFSYVVGDGKGGTSTAIVTVTITGENDGPVLGAVGALDVEENTTAVVTLTATDVDGDPLSFAIAGGDDAGLFDIDAMTGALTFKAAPDFEAPGDLNGDNAYLVSVSVSDGQGGVDMTDITVTVTDVDETPPISILVTEIMYNPRSGEPDWEWVEIVNTGADAVDLSGWVFDDANTVFQSGSNIASGMIEAGGSAVLYNADDITAADFAAAWGDGINLIAVTDWSRASLNNSGDTLALWDSFASYQGDEQTFANAVIALTYDDSNPWPSDDGNGSIYLTDLNADPTNGANWALSGDGDTTPVGTSRTAIAAGGNSGQDVGSPDGTPQPLVINEFVGSTAGADVEFIELVGAAGTSLAGLSLVVVESDAGTSTGRIDARFDFAADAEIGENGFYLVGNSLVTGLYNVTPDAELPGGFLENSSYTLALVETASAGAVGDQAGPEVVIDSIGVSDGGTGDTFAYGAPVIGPDGSFLPAGGFRLADGVDTDTAADWGFADFSTDPGNSNTPTPSDTGGGTGPTVRTISEVQGSGDASAFVGEEVTVTAIVVGDFQNGDGDDTRNLGGFWLQAEVGDGDDATSDGIFVFEGDFLTDVSLGDRVTVTGTVAEFFGATQISASSVTIDQAGAVADVNTLAVDVSLDAINDVVVADGDFIPDLEQYEGMLVTFTDTLTINETFQLDRFNEVRLTAGDRPEQFTQINAPDAAGFDAYQRQIGSDQIVFDDGLAVQNAPIFAEADLNNDGTYTTADGFGMGDQITGLTGVLDFSFNEYRVRGVEDGANTFVDAQTREETPPDVGGTITVSSFNVLNFFSTIDGGPFGSGPNLLDPRGADSLAEFDRQLEKLVTTLSAIDADVFGLVELENEFGTDQNGDGLVAINVLVEALNTSYGAGTWAAVDPGRGFVDTGDAISVGMIYKTASVSLVTDSVKILDDSQLDALGFGTLDDDGLGVFDGPSTNRAPLLGTFVDTATGEDFSVAVTHMKSKGGTGTGGNADQNDGAGNFNELRDEGVQVLTQWLDREADNDLLVLGDFNAYLREDPIVRMEAAGYTNLEEVFNPGSSTFVFDGQTGTLDYAFGTGTILDNVTGAAAWHINSDEPDAQDYNLDFGRDPAIFDGTSPIRSSDHDPLLIGLDFSAPTTLVDFV